MKAELDLSDSSIRLNAYQILGYTEKAFEDEYWEIRREAYRVLGYTEKAFDDEDCDIRIEAYRALGYTTKAFDDEDSTIRSEAGDCFQIKEKFSKEELQTMLELYQLEKL